MFTLASLTALLSRYGYAFLLPAAVIEGPIITVLVGSLVSLGIFSFFPALALIVVGDTIGDYLHYAAGRYGGLPFLRRWGAYFGVSVGRLGRLEAIFKRHEVKSYFLGKLAHGAGGAVLVVAGLVRIPLPRFLFWNVVTTIIKSFFLLALGYYFAHALARINSVFETVASIAIVLGIAVGFALLWWYGRQEEL